jgi:hypothetical protein
LSFGVGKAVELGVGLDDQPSEGEPIDDRGSYIRPPDGQSSADPEVNPTPEQIQAIHLAWADAAA